MFHLHFHVYIPTQQSLVELSLRRTSVITDTSIVSLAEKRCLRSLEKLNLNSLQQITDKTLVSLAKHAFEALQEIDVSFCRKISDAGMGNLVDSCPQMKKVHVWGDSQLTEKFSKGHSRLNLSINGMMKS